MTSLVLFVSTVRMPAVDGEPDELHSCLLQATIRVNAQTMHWVVEFIFSRVSLWFNISIGSLLPLT